MVSRGMLVALAVLISGCGGSVPLVDKVASFAPTDTGHTYLARQVEALGDPHDGRSGIHLLSDGPEALAMRLHLTEKAERSIDVQYYILTNDTSGQLIAGELLKAADRGVHVRILLDDMYAAPYDPASAALAGHPHIDIRLFNPFRRDVGRMLGGLLDFQRVNRRMHNKSMTFDDQVTIVGGRNLADEYFAAREDSNYDDLDVLAVGPVAREVSGSFDDYWNSPYAVPAEAAIIAGGGRTLAGGCADKAHGPLRGRAAYSLWRRPHPRYPAHLLRRPPRPQLGFRPCSGRSARKGRWIHRRHPGRADAANRSWGAAGACDRNCLFRPRNSGRGPPVRPLPARSACSRAYQLA